MRWRSFKLREEILRLLEITPSLCGLAKRFERCDRDAILFYCEQCGRCYAVPYACNLVMCEHCSKRISRRIYRRYFDRIKGKQDLKHVTLTWGHGELSRDVLRGIYRGFVEVLKTYWKTFVAVLEISPGWHVHVHAIVSGKYVPQQLLSNTANRILGRPVVWINRAVPKKLGYLLKYVSKPPEFHTAREYVRYLRLMHRLRRIRNQGEFYGDREERTSLLICRECGWYLYFDCIEENGWWKEIREPLHGYEPPTKVIMIRGGIT